MSFPRSAWCENHLANEASPYLKAHATNPVDWYPWGEAAFAKARAEDKPVLLSIGYATCHWCHVMAHESFEDAEVAKFLNEHFVSIKVDREELPDVDRFYVGFVAAQTGSAGWPLTVFLSPDRTPFIGGTYFPRDRFLKALQVVDGQWRTNRKALVDHGQEALGRLGVPAATDAAQEPARLVDATVAGLMRRFDATDGGFDEAPKFPQAPRLFFLLRARAHTGADALLSREPQQAQTIPRSGVQLMLERTLRAMALGGIHDQLGHGFHRYTLDAAWRVPHFEKMLYDQAQLARLYLEASRLPSPDAEWYRRIGADTIGFVLRELQAPGGGFIAALDADSPPAAGAPPSEGVYYLWSVRQIEDAVSDAGAAKQLEARFCMRTDGNIPPMFDDRGELRGKNVLRLAEPTPAETLAPAIALLADARAKRPPPTRDDQLVVAWNGMMIRALAAGFALTKDPEWLAAAQRAAKRVLGAWSDGRGLARSGSLDGSWRGRGGAADYAELELGLIALNAADHDAAWLDQARKLQDRLDRDFWDERSSTYFDGPADPALPTRMRSDDDEAEPAADSAAAEALTQLVSATGEDAYADRLRRLLDAYRGILARGPLAMPTLIALLLPPDTGR